MDIEVNVSGDIVERQELLNGTQMITLEGANADGAWTFSGSLSWNIGLADARSEGDVTVARGDGSELFATLADATIGESSEHADADLELTLTYDIDGGTRDFDHASGSIELRGVLVAEQFHAVLQIRIVET